MRKLCLILLISAFGTVAFAQTGKTIPVKVYFSDLRDNPNFEDCGKVRAVKRRVPKTRAVARAALRELFKGPTEEEKADGLDSVFSANTKDILLRIKIRKGAAYVNYRKEIIEKLGSATTSCGGLSYISSVERTLKQFRTIKKVFFAIEGSPKDYYDWTQAGECPKELRNCSNRNF